MKRFVACFMAVLMISLTACGAAQPKEKIDGVKIALSDEEITVDGSAVSNDTSDAVYAAHDIVFYLAGQGIAYGEGESADEHTQLEADAHTVVHITKPGTYIVSGQLSAGQIAVDLGKNAASDPNAVVTLVLSGVDITCQVAPAIIFYNVYECGNKDNAAKDVDTSAAGANIVIADGSENTVNGSYVAKIYKSCTLSEDGSEVLESKKLHKYDGAVYSRMSMNVSGGEKNNGILNINAENEGLDSELHLTVNGGNINIISGDDGINTNEDGVSVTTINGGDIHITINGKQGEGDGIDSNGWLVINGGRVIAEACATSGDAGIDSDMGIYINGGTVIASGNMLDSIVGSRQNYAVFTFAKQQEGKGQVYTLKNDGGETVMEAAPSNAFTYLILSAPELQAVDDTLWLGDTQMSGTVIESDRGGKMQLDGQQMPQMPEGQQMPSMPMGEAPSGNNQQPPEIPDGTDGMKGNINEQPQNEVIGEKSTTFAIMAGGNYFRVD